MSRIVLMDISIGVAAVFGEFPGSPQARYPSDFFPPFLSPPACVTEKTIGDPISYMRATQQEAGTGTGQTALGVKKTMVWPQC
jgi:hypothetical protein